MTRIKILAVIGIVIGSIGCLASFYNTTTDPGLCLLGFVIYGFMLWLSIEVKCTKEIK